MAGLRVNFKQLRTAVDWSIGQLEAPRRNRVDAIRQFVTTHYSDSGPDKRVPVNMIELATTIYLRQLAPQTPRVMVSTKVRRLKPFAKTMELVLNEIPDEIGLDDTLQRCVLEAMFAFGVCKMGISYNGSSYKGHEVGEAFVDPIDLDDYFFDMSAKTFSGIQFEGNDYWLPVDVARSMYDGKQSDVEPDDHTVIGSDGGERADGIGVDEGADLYREKVWLRDVFLHDSRQMVTYGVKSQKLFRVIDWDGPECGPYHRLSFSEVPGNIRPLPPIALWTDLHELGNALFRKLAKQAESKKSVAGFSGGNDESVNAFQAANDGDGIRYNGQKPETITVGGIDAPALAFFLQVRDLFSYFAGNLDTLGGLAPMTDTVGQDRMLSDAADARLSKMRGRTMKFVSGIFKSLAWYEWTDPVRKRTVEKPVKGTDITLPVVWSAETRDGDFLDYNLDIDAHSMAPDSPSIKLQKIGMGLERFVFPILPAVQEQGGRIDLQKLIEIISQLSNTPELADIVVFDGQGGEGAPQRGGSETPVAMPAHTTRTYERVNRPGATRHGKDDVLTRALMGVGVQNSEMAAVGRGA